jgi:chromosome segregation ATPase
MSVQGSEELFVLSRKLDELIERYVNLKKNLEDLNLVNESLSRSLRDKDEQIKDLEVKYDRLKLSGALLGESGNAGEAKKRLGELLREIDRCVALLNR